MTKCSVCFDTFGAEGELDRHLADEHNLGPLAPRPVCPESMRHVRDMLVDAMLPDWVKAPPRGNVEVAAKTKAVLLDLDGATVDHLLTVLHDAGYSIRKDAGGGETPMAHRAIDAPGGNFISHNPRQGVGAMWTVAMINLSHTNPLFGLVRGRGEYFRDQPTAQHPSGRIVTFRDRVLAERRADALNRQDPA
ncbi:hypothetical protein [Mycolicibacterium sp.]|uniref:hypothetical protein n=1 Tax=Mycolicibacterium sp. TaxID=2320850 RepID=UPI0037CA6798